MGKVSVTFNTNISDESNWKRYLEFQAKVNSQGTGGVFEHCFSDGTVYVGKVKFPKDGNPAGRAIFEIIQQPFKG